jgi:methylated-DNA-protein-cysteine methyltransferase-like protein
MEQTTPKALHGPEEFYEEVYSIVGMIPPGKVLTYGAIARLTGRPRHARLVGRALRSTPSDRGIPCHRVVNSRGGTAPGWARQRVMLEDEGVPFGRNGCAVLSRCLWQPENEFAHP